MTSLNSYPDGTRVRIGSRTFVKVAPGSFWREEDRVPGNCVTRPAVSLETIKQQTGQGHVIIGFFVDWDGKTRRVEAPGDGYTCQVVQRNGYIGVDMLDGDGDVWYEAVYYAKAEDVLAVGVPIHWAG